MLNGQNTFSGGGGGPGGGGFPSMGGGQPGAQYGRPNGPPGNAFPGQMQPGGMGMGPGGGQNMQSPFGGDPPMGPGGQRGSLDGRGRQTSGAPPGLQRQASGGMPMVGAPRGAPNMMQAGQAGSFPRPSVMQGGQVGGVQPGTGGADLLAMINKQQGGANLSSFGNAGGLGFMSGDVNGAAPPGFDLNDFPSLGGPGGGIVGGQMRGGGFGVGMGGMGGEFGGGMGMGMGMQSGNFPSGGGGLFGGMDGMGSADGYGVLGVQKPHPEFTMQNEDFPALGGGPGGVGPGANAPGIGGQQKSNSNSLQNAGGFPHLGGMGSMSNHSGDSGFPSLGQSGMSKPGGYGTGGFPGQAGPYAGSYDGSGDAAAGTGNDVDRFGLIGLLSVIRMSDPDLTTLALGTDLTTLGLNLNSPEPLHKTFGSPWSDAPPRHELELQLPACYAVHTKRPNALAFSKFTPETLFYVFYSSPGDEARLFAADELAKRGWGFHKELKAWLTRVQGTEPVSKTVVGERGSFWIFDVSSWERVRKDNFNLQYDALEQPPSGGEEGKTTQDAGAAIGSQE